MYEQVCDRDGKEGRRDWRRGGGGGTRWKRVTEKKEWKRRREGEETSEEMKEGRQGCVNEKKGRKERGHNHSEH